MKLFYRKHLDNIAPSFCFVMLVTSALAGAAQQETPRGKAEPPPSDGYITGRTIVCPEEPVEYTAHDPVSGTHFEWEIEGGSLTNPSGGTTTARWTANTGTLSLYRVSNEPPYCRTLVQTLNVQLFDIQNLTISPDTNNDYYANCEQHFYATYNGVPYTEADNYTWRIQPNSAGSVTENVHGYNPVVLLNHTTTTLTNRTIELDIMKCGTSTKYSSFDIYPVPAPQVKPSVSTVCSGESVFFTIENAHLYSNITYSVNIAEHPVGDSTFSHTFDNAGVGQQDLTVPVRITGYRCGVPYTTTLSITVKPLPKVSLSPIAIGPFCEDEDIDFNITSNIEGGVSSYQWYNSDVLLNNNSATSLHVENVGAYSLVVTGTNGCTASSNVVTVEQVDCSDFPPDSIPDECEAFFEIHQNCNQFTAILSPYDFDQITWSYTPGLNPIGQTDSSITLSASAAGVYVLEVIAFKDSFDCGFQKSQGIAIPVVPSCEVSISCNGQNQHVAHFHNTSSMMPNAPVSFFFILDNTTTNADHAVLLPGTQHTLQIMSVCDGDTCYSDIVTFTIPTLSAAFTINHTPICQDNPVYFTPAQIAGGMEYLWDFGTNNGQLNATLGTHNFQSPDNYAITLTIQDIYGCVASATGTVDILANGFNNGGGGLRPTTIPALCEGDTIILYTFLGQNNYEPPLAYQWSHGADTASSAAATQTGAYTVTVTDFYSCHTVLGPANVSVTSIPQIEIMGRREVCLGDRIQLSGYYGQDYIYQWSRTAPDSVQNIGSGPSIDLPADTVETFSYQLVVAPPQNPACSSTESVDVTVRPLPDVPNIQVDTFRCTPCPTRREASP